MNEITDILKLSPPVLLMVALAGFAQMLKQIPKVPRWAIPVILPFAGAIAYTFIGSAIQIPWIADVEYPTVAHGMIGFICGSTTVGFHQALRQFTNRNANNEKDTGSNSTG